MKETNGYIKKLNWLLSLYLPKGAKLSKAVAVDNETADFLVENDFVKLAICIHEKIPFLGKLDNKKRKQSSIFKNNGYDVIRFPLSKIAKDTEEVSWVILEKLKDLTKIAAGNFSKLRHSSLLKKKKSKTTYKTKKKNYVNIPFKSSSAYENTNAKMPRTPSPVVRGKEFCF